MRTERESKATFDQACDSVAALTLLLAKVKLGLVELEDIRFHLLTARGTGPAA